MISERDYFVYYVQYLKVRHKTRKSKSVVKDSIGS